MRFRHQTIDVDPRGSLHDITLIADVDGNGRNEIIAGPTIFWPAGECLKLWHPETPAPSLVETCVAASDILPERHIDVWFNED